MASCNEPANVGDPTNTSIVSRNPQREYVLDALVMVKEKINTCEEVVIYKCPHAGQ
jgi:hypothetical protein